MVTEQLPFTEQPDFIRWMKERDVRAMEILYDQYATVLYGVIFWITGDEKKSEEILFRTLTHIWNHYSSVDVPVQNTCLWMLHIARRFCFESLNREELLKVKDQWLLFIRERGWNEQAEILGYAFFKGMSVQTMAEKFNCSESVIRKQLHEAVNYLKKEYVAK